MIREIQIEEKQMLLDFIKRDNARNYFVRLGLEGEKAVFEKIYGEFDGKGLVKAVLLKRLSGNLQFFATEIFDLEEFSKIIKDMEFDYLISPATCCDPFSGRGLFSSEIEGAYIAELKKEEWNSQPVEKVALGEVKKSRELETRVEPISTSDLYEIVELYKEVFNSFSSDAVMRKKLETGRGRGVCIKQEGKIVCVAQSEFENETSGIIVGVATAKGYEKRGFATTCLRSIISALTEEGKDLYLQYDNPKAGEIYKRLGFKEIDRVKHYKK